MFGTGNSFIIQIPTLPCQHQKAQQTLKTWRGDILLPSHQPQGWSWGEKSELDPNPTSVNRTQESFKCNLQESAAQSAMTPPTHTPPHLYLINRQVSQHSPWNLLPLAALLHLLIPGFITANFLPSPSQLLSLPSLPPTRGGNQPKSLSLSTES